MSLGPSAFHTLYNNNLAMFKIGFEFWRPTFFYFVGPTFVFPKIRVSEWIGLSPIGPLLGRILSQTILNLVKFNLLVRTLSLRPVFCGQRSRIAFMHYLSFESFLYAYWPFCFLQELPVSPLPVLY